MAKKKLIIEMRINEYAMRDNNPNVPWTPSEIAHDAFACREAGAAILHFHARRPDGAMDFTYDTYRDTIQRLREGSDLLAHPTLGAFERSASAEDRLSHIIQLANEGLAPDFAPLDMGSSNADMFDPKERRFLSDTRVYANTTETLRYFATTLRRHRVKPYMVIWNVGMLRWALAFHQAGLADAPLYLGLSLGGDTAPSLHPASEAGLRAYTTLLPEDVPIEWTVMLYGGNLLPLAETIIRSGGHISIGLGDYGYRELGTPTNADLIARIAEIAHDCGRAIATPEEAREMLGMVPVHA